MKRLIAFLILLLLPLLVRAIQPHLEPPFGKPDAIVDLATTSGLRLFKGEWRTMDAQIDAIQSKGVGADLKPSGAPNQTHEIAPHAGAESFDDATWTVLKAEKLDDRRSTGRFAFSWYRTTLTVPDRVGSLATKGTTIAFEIVVDDYAEVWVNGKLPLVLGSTGGGFIKGFNAPNRVILTDNAQPGQTFQIAVFGANGPLSQPPHNFVWVRSATLDIYRSPSRVEARGVGRIVREDPALDAVIAKDAVIERLASGFQFTEGPVWDSSSSTLLFSDPNENTIYRYEPAGKVSVFRVKSGYSGIDIGDYRQPGSNGIAIDRDGRVTINEHGRRRVVRIERNGQISVLADRYRGKRLNSPNDLVYKSDGSLYFTDPPFGLPNVFDDPRKELPYSGVYRVKDGQITLLTADLKGPNGIAFSPDETYLYVSNWDPQKKWLMRYPVNPDGTLGKGSVFFDMGRVAGDDALDGIKVDQMGTVYSVGPEGIWVLTPEAKLLGRIELPEHVANCAWGDDGRSLYMTASSGLYRIRVNIPGKMHL